MSFFLHSFIPERLLFSYGFIHIYWYGLTMALAIGAGLAITLILSRKAGLEEEKVFDLAFWLVIAGLVGARIYEIFLNFQFYLSDPWQMARVWEGGLAIHGAIIGGLVALFLYCRRQKLDFLTISSLLAPGLALGQAIGRWGNWFNQELFGLPTSLPWGIPISFENRPEALASFQYFQPTFLYESLGCLAIFFFLFFWEKKAIRKNELAKSSAMITGSYLLLYSIVRFSLEFIKVDTTPILLGWRWPQLVSLLGALAGIILITRKRHVQDLQ